MINRLDGNRGKPVPTFFFFVHLNKVTERRDKISFYKNPCLYVIYALSWAQWLSIHEKQYFFNNLHFQKKKICAWQCQCIAVSRNIISLWIYIIPCSLLLRGGWCVCWVSFVICIYNNVLVLYVQTLYSVYMRCTASIDFSIFTVTTSK